MKKKVRTGRPPSIKCPVGISCTVEKAQWRWLNAESVRKGLTVSGVIRGLLQKKVDRVARAAEKMSA